MLEQYLRCFISYQQDYWSNILHLAEFAYKNMVHSSTKVTPFFAYTGNHPRWCILRLCLECCCVAHLNLNPTKCAFNVTSGELLDHIVSCEGIAVDLGKIKAIIMAPTPKNAKVLSHFLGQICWHNEMLCYLVDFATPLHDGASNTVQLDRDGRQGIYGTKSHAHSGIGSTTTKLDC